MKLNWQGPFSKLTPEDKKSGVKSVDYPDENGVYVIAEKLDNEIRARYVGQGNIKQRISDHKNDNGVNDELEDLMQNRKNDYRIYYSLLSNQTDMDNAEFSVFTGYGGLKKLYNKKIPSGTLVPINLPF